MVKFLNRQQLKTVIKDLKYNGFSVTVDDGWHTARDDDGTKVLVAMPHSNGSFMVNYNNDYFSEV